MSHNKQSTFYNEDDYHAAVESNRRAGIEHVLATNRSINRSLHRAGELPTRFVRRPVHVPKAGLLAALAGVAALGGIPGRRRR